MTELIPPSNPIVRAYNYTVYHSTSPACLTTVLAVCQHVAKETLKEHYKRLQSDPSDSDELNAYSFVYENVSEVVIKNNQILVLAVEANEITEVQPDLDYCVTLDASDKQTGEIK